MYRKVEVTSSTLVTINIHTGEFLGVILTYCFLWYLKNSICVLHFRYFDAKTVLDIQIWWNIFPLKWRADKNPVINVLPLSCLLCITNFQFLVNSKGKRIFCKEICPRVCRNSRSRFGNISFLHQRHVKQNSESVLTLYGGLCGSKM